MVSLTATCLKVLFLSNLPYKFTIMSVCNELVATFPGRLKFNLFISSYHCTVVTPGCANILGMIGILNAIGKAVT